MAKILFVGDVHLSDRPPIGRDEGYRHQILSKLLEIANLSHNVEADATVFLGDIFHSKRPMFTSHGLVQRVQSELSHFNGDVFIVPGNHDMGPEGIASLDRQPLGVLRESVTHILGWTTDTYWEHHFTLIARPYSAARDLDPTYYALTDEEKLLPAPRIVVCHGSLGPKDDPLWGVEYHHYALPVEDIDTSGMDLLVSGHIHEPFGPIVLENGTIFFNPGSISRTSRKEINYTREPKVVLLDTAPPARDEVLKYTDIPLTSVLPAEEVFISPEEGGGAVVTDKIREFANAAAGGLNLETVTVDQLLSKRDGVSDAAKEIMREELESAGV